MNNWIKIGLLSLLPYGSTAIDVSLDIATFKNGTQGYLEVYLHVVGTSVNFESLDSIQQQATVEVMLQIEKDNAIIIADKLMISSPIVAVPTDFVDVKRYKLDNGDYRLMAFMKDKSKSEDEVNIQKVFSLNYNLSPIEQSDIQLLASAKAATDPNHPFAKRQFLLEPLPTHFLQKELTSLLFYNEVYLQNTTKPLKLRYFIDRVLNGDRKTVKIVNKRKVGRGITPLLLSIDISDVASGNYTLTVEVRDTTEALLSAKSIPFQRSNPYLKNLPIPEEELGNETFVATLSPKELDIAIKAIVPILPQNMTAHANKVLADQDTIAQRLLLFNYWAGKNPNLPKVAYDAYMKVIWAIDRQFRSGFRNGFETDRGVIYLRYGRPDDIVRVEDEPSAPPYEIWSYNEFPQTMQNNVRFLFYNPSLAPEDFVLLHSTARTELNNPQWEIQLYQDAPNEIQGNDPFGATEMQDNFGRRARRLMNDF